MKTKNVPAETMKRIEGLEKKKADELTNIKQKLLESRTALSSAKDAIQNATERTDLKAYQDAKEKEAEAAAAIEMYEARYKQIECREYVTQKGSDEVIDQLLQYEADIAEEYVNAIAGPVAEIKKAHDDYIQSVQNAEHTIASWTGRIHHNYRAELTTFPDGTNISKVPVPVHQIPFTGCAESAVVGVFLDKLVEKKISE